jgi:hypothetical protein
MRMPAQTSNPNPTPRDCVDRVGRIWSRCTRIQCAGLLHIALRYGERENATNAWIESLAMMAWPELGESLQRDIASAVLALESVFR